jgi:hypothetical protein
LPQFRGFDQLRVQVGHFVEGDRRVLFEEIHHFGGDRVAQFEAEGFDDGFAGATMPTSGIGEQK